MGHVFTRVVAGLATAALLFSSAVASAQTLTPDDSSWDDLMRGQGVVLNLESDDLGGPFDGKRIIDLSPYLEGGLSRLRDVKTGSIVTRFKVDSDAVDSVNVLVSASSAQSAGLAPGRVPEQGKGYAAIATIRDGELPAVRAAFHHVAYKNKVSLPAPFDDGEWHTAVFSSTDAKSIRLTVDGQELYRETDAKWCGLFSTMSDVAHASVGGYLAPDGSCVNGFHGMISNVIITTDEVSDEQAMRVSKTGYSGWKSISKMFDAADDNTWAFVGGSEVAGDFEHVRGARGYVGQFEEYIRWTLANNGAAQMQRYTINLGVAGQALSDVVHQFEMRVKPLNVAAVAYLVGPEDWQAGSAGIEAFKKDLNALIKASVSLRNGKGFFVVQKPHRVGDEKRDAQIGEYARAVDAVVAGRSASEQERIVVVDHYANSDSVIKEGLSQDGQLNALGHRELGRQLAFKTIGTSEGFPGKGVDLNLRETPQPSTYLDVEPQVSVKDDTLMVKIPDTALAHSQNGWRYRLNTDGLVLEGEGEAKGFAIPHVSRGAHYTLKVRSRDESVQLVTVTGIVSDGETAHVKTPEKTRASREIAEKMKSGKPLTWLFMGDSITHGALWTIGYDSVPQSFTKYLASELKRPEDTVINTAVSGSTTLTTLDHIDRRLEMYVPDVVFLMLGTNDCGPAGKTVSLSDYKKNLRVLVGKIYERNPAATIILRSPTGVTQGYASMVRYRDAMEEIAHELNLTFIDQYSPFQKSLETYTWIASTWTGGPQTGNLLYGNALHPGANGQLDMFRMVLEGCGFDIDDNALANLRYQEKIDEERSKIVPEVSTASASIVLSLDGLALRQRDMGAVTVSVADDATGQIRSKTSLDAAGLLRINGLEPGKTYTVSVSSYLTDRPVHLSFSDQKVQVRGEAAETHTVSYKIEGDVFSGDTYEIQTYEVGERIEAPEPIFHVGYAFSGWKGLPENGVMGHEDLLVSGSYATDKRSGITKGQPFVSGETVGSRRFRIPALDVLDNGLMVACADARWGTTADSPNNLDTAVSVSADGGKTWHYELANEFVDYPSSNGGAKNKSASFIDPAIVQDSNGTIYLMADAWPAGSGIWGTGGNVCERTGFDDRGNFLLMKGRPGEIASTDGDLYTYYADESDAQTYSIDGRSVALRPIKNDDGERTGYAIDAGYNLWELGAQGVRPSTTKQYESGKTIQNNVMYAQSEFKAYPTCYVWMLTGTPTKTGISWGSPQILNIKHADDQPFTGVCPGHGLIVPMKDGAERVLFQVYESKRGGNEVASTVYSDDGGKTWHRGERAAEFNGAGKGSESQTILLPDGGVRMYSRNAAGFIFYADSKDGGISWGSYSKDEELAYCGNCMVSFINLKGSVTAPDGTVYDNLVAASYPQGPNRANGVIRIGSITDDTNHVTWLNEASVRYPGSFIYSCLAQINEGELGILAERQLAGDGTDDVVYDTASLVDLLGPGWTASASLRLTVSDTVLLKGQTVALSAIAAGDDAPTDIVWSLVGDDQVASLSAKTSKANEPVVLSALKPGKVRVTAVAEKRDGRNVMRYEAARDFYIIEDCGKLPDDIPFGHIEKVSGGKGVPYVLDASEKLDDGTFAVYSAAQNRIMVTTDGKTGNRSTPKLNEAGTELTLDESAKTNEMTWKIERTESGLYTIRSLFDDKMRFVTLASEGAYISLESDPCLYELERDQNGATYFKTEVNGSQLYLAHIGGNPFWGATTSKSANAAFKLYRESTFYTVDVKGLAGLLNHVAGLNLQKSDFTPESWEAYADALLAAQEAYKQASAFRSQSQSEAQRVLADADTALNALFQAYCGLDRIEYALRYRIEGQHFIGEIYEEQRYAAGAAIVPLKPHQHAGYSFSGWRGLPPVMPSHDVEVSGVYEPAGTPDPGPNPPDPAPEPGPDQKPLPNPTPKPDKGDGNGSSAHQHGQTLPHTGDAVSPVTMLVFGVAGFLAMGVGIAKMRKGRRNL